MMIMSMIVLISVTLEKTVTISNWLPQSLLMVHQRIKRTAHHDSARWVHTLCYWIFRGEEYFLNLGVTLYEWKVGHGQKKLTIARLITSKKRDKGPCVLLMPSKVSRSKGRQVGWEGGGRRGGGVWGRRIIGLWRWSQLGRISRTPDAPRRMSPWARSGPTRLSSTSFSYIIIWTTSKSFQNIFIGKVTRNKPYFVGQPIAVSDISIYICLIWYPIQKQIQRTTEWEASRFVFILFENTIRMIWNQKLCPIILCVRRLSSI